MGDKLEVFSFVLFWVEMMESILIESLNQFVSHYFLAFILRRKGNQSKLDGSKYSKPLFMSGRKVHLLLLQNF